MRLIGSLFAAGICSGPALDWLNGGCSAIWLYQDHHSPMVRIHIEPISVTNPRKFRSLPTRQVHLS